MTAGRLKDRIALITGASRGIGRAVAEAFAREGAHVLLLARTRKSLEQVDDAITARGGTATLIPLNLAARPKIDALGPTLYERFGRLDVLVGNAAILGRLSPLPHIPSEHWERRFDRQRHGQLAADPHARSAAPPLGCRAGDLRHLVGVAQQGRAYWAPYSVSKAALECSGQDLRQRDRATARSR